MPLADPARRQRSNPKPVPVQPEATVWTLPDGTQIGGVNLTEQEIALLESLGATQSGSIPIDPLGANEALGGLDAMFQNLDPAAIADALAQKDAYGNAIATIDQNLALQEQEAKIRDYVGDVEFASRTQPTAFALNNSGITGPAADYALRLRELGRQGDQRLADIGVLAQRSRADALRADAYNTLLNGALGFQSGQIADAVKLVRGLNG